MIAGQLAGLAALPVVAPSEHLKILLQAAQANAAAGETARKDRFSCYEDAALSFLKHGLCGPGTKGTAAGKRSAGGKAGKAAAARVTATHTILIRQTRSLRYPHALS